MAVENCRREPVSAGDVAMETNTEAGVPTDVVARQVREFVKVSDKIEPMRARCQFRFIYLFVCLVTFQERSYPIFGKGNRLNNVSSRNEILWKSTEI